VFGETVRLASDWRIRRRRRIRLGLFWVSVVAGAVVTAGVLGWIGSLLLPDESVAVAAVLGALVAAALVRETVRPRWPVPQRHWQVPQHWLTGPWSGAIVFGSIMGAGVFTRQPSALFHLYVLACVASASPWTGAAFGCVYGLAYVGGFVRGMSVGSCALPDRGAVDWVVAAWRRVRWVGVAAAPLLVSVPLQ
jgi:hypothetical protein